MKRKFRIALIGCGSVSANHFTAIDALENVTPVALCDLNAERAGRVKEQRGYDAEIYTDYIKMYDEVKPDAVHIATPHYLHAPMAIEALKRNIFVFLEKPMCISTEQMEQMLAAERESRAAVTVCFQNRFCPAFLKLKEMAEEDGGAEAVYGSLFWERNEKYYTESGWRGSYATEGGGVMINQAIHTLDLMGQLLGIPMMIQATKCNRHLAGIIEVEDTCEGIVTYDSGKQGCFYATTAFKRVASTTLCAVTKRRSLEMRGYELFADGERVDTEDHKNYAGKACYGNGHIPLIRMFYEAIEAGEEMPVTMESAKHAVRLLLAAYRSDNKPTKI